MAPSFPSAFRLHQNQALFVNFGEGGVAWKTQIFGPTNNVTLVWWSMEFVYCAVQCVCCQILFSLSRVLGVIGKVWCRVTQDGETSSWWMLWDRLRDSLIVFEILSVLGVEWPNDEHWTPSLTSSSGQVQTSLFFPSFSYCYKKLCCQAQAQVRLSLRLTQAHSGSLWLLLCDFDSVTWALS